MSDLDVAVPIGTGRIGVAIARRSAVERRLLLADHNPTRLAAVAEQLHGEGYEVDTMVVDVSDQATVDALANYAAALGSVTRLIHAPVCRPSKAPPERIVAVDLLGTAYVLEAFGRVIASEGSGVVIASQAGHMGSFPADLERTLAYGSIAELHDLPALADIDDSGPSYILARRANALRVQAAAIPWQRALRRFAERPSGDSHLRTVPGEPPGERLPDAGGATDHRHPGSGQFQLLVTILPQASRLAWPSLPGRGNIPPLWSET